VEVEISQADLEKLVENWPNGTPSPFYKRKDRLRGGEPIAVATFADERVLWIGKVDTVMFSTRNNSDFGVYMGVSPYRVVFYRAATVFSDLCRSYWFEIDTGDRTWERGRVRKKEYQAAGLARPRFKKGLVGRQILIAGNLTRVGGKVDTVFKYELSGLEWLNPQSGKFEGRKGQELCDQLTEAYDSRLAVSASALWLMENDTRRALVIPGSGDAAGREQLESEAPVAVGEVEEGPIEVAMVAAEEEEGVCPQCGNQLRPGIAFCGKCGYGLKAEEGEGAEAEGEADEAAGAPCPVCGFLIRPGIQFCGKCGHRLEEEPAEPQVEEPVEEEEESVAPEVEESVEQTETPGGGPSADPDEGPKCSHCGKAVEEDWRACPYCGEGLRIECPECGKATRPDWVVCPYCGEALKDR
jgi:RNA polymerase subunit RPABC4/transcription elongation factor Spt4